MFRPDSGFAATAPTGGLPPAADLAAALGLANVSASGYASGYASGRVCGAGPLPFPPAPPLAPAPPKGRYVASSSSVPPPRPCASKEPSENRRSTGSARQGARPHVPGMDRELCMYRMHRRKDIHI